MLLSLILLLSYSISTQGVIINGRQCQCTCTDPEHPVQKVYTNGNLKVKANSQNSINVKTDDITTSSQKLPKEKQKLTKGKQKMSTGIKRDKIISVSKDLTSHVKGDKTSGAVKYNKNINSKSNISVHANTNGQRTSEYIQIGPTYGAEDNYTMLGHGYIVPLNDKTIVIANSKNQENKKIGKTISENGKETIQKLNSVWDVLGKEQIQKKKPNIDNTVWNKLSTAPTNNNNNNNGNFPGNNQPFNNRQSNNNINHNKNMGMQRNNMNGNNNNNNNQWQTQSRNNSNNNNPNNGNINNNNPWKNGNNNNNQQWNPNNNNNNQQWNPNNNNQQWNPNNNNNQQWNPNNNNQQWNPNNNNQQWNPNNNNNQQWNPNNNNQQWNPNNNNQQWNPNNNNKNNNNNNNQQWNGNNNIDQPQNQNNNNDQQWNRNNNQNQLLNPIDNKNDIIKLWSKMRTLLRSKQQSMSQALSWRTRQNGRSFPNKLSRNQRRMRKKVGTTMSPQDMAEEMFGTSEVDPIILEILSKSNQKQFNL